MITLLEIFSFFTMFILPKTLNTLLVKGKFTTRQFIKWQFSVNICGYILGFMIKNDGVILAQICWTLGNLHDLYLDRLKNLYLKIYQYFKKNNLLNVFNK